MLVDNGEECASFEGINLIEKSDVLDSFVDDDDIEWKPDPFELLTMIQFEGPPEFQEQLRTLCREFIDVFSTSVRSRPANVEPMTIDVNRSKCHPARTVRTVRTP